ncbi:MAG: hypothetical protein HC859_09070 [Bacteroidia bacterium]|nr:hypothetical protein [Bacteroidia bacterium]
MSNTTSCQCALSITLNQIKKASTCTSADGNIDIGVSGGSGAYTYNWTNQSGTQVSTSQDPQNLLPGFYFLRVTDQVLGCAGQQYYEVASDLSIGVAATLNTSCITPNGTITVTMTGGSGNFTYEWTFPDNSIVTTRNLSALKSATYVLKVTDITRGCSIQKSVSVKSQNSLATSLVQVTPNSSCKTPNGGVDLAVSGGSGSYAYYWYNAALGAYVSYTQDLQNVRGGDYSIYVVDNVSGCTAYTSVSVPETTQPPAYQLEVIPNDNCSAPYSGAITLTPAGTGPYRVTWSNGKDVLPSTLALTGLAPGKYGFTLIDDGTGCVVSRSYQGADPVVIPDASVPAIAVTVNQVLNNGSCSAPNGEIKITVNTGGYPYTIQWTGPNGYTSESEHLTSLGSGKYTGTVQVTCNEPPTIEPPTIALRTTNNEPLREVSIALESFISDPNNNLDLSSAAVVSQPKSQAKATITPAYELLVEYRGITYKGTDELTLRACDLLGACTEQSLSINVDVSGDVIVFNAVSPTSSGDNKFMRIFNLPPDIGNRVYIYNRWGDVVYHTSNYDNDDARRRFEGLSDHGKELPTGTYYYKIEVGDGRSALTGYLALKQ